MYRGTSEPGAVEAGSRHPSPQLKLRRDARWVPAQSARARAGPGPRGEGPAPRRTHISPGPALGLVAPTGRPSPASVAGPVPPHPRGDPGAAAAQGMVGEEVGVRLPPCPAALPPPPAEGRQSRPAPRRGREVTHRRRLRAALSSAAAAPLSRAGCARPLHGRQTLGSTWRSASPPGRAGAPASAPRPRQRRRPSDSRAPPLRRQPGARGRAAGRAAAYRSGPGRAAPEPRAGVSPPLA